MTRKCFVIFEYYFFSIFLGEVTPDLPPLRSKFA